MQHLCFVTGVENFVCYSTDLLCIDRGTPWNTYPVCRLVAGHCSHQPCRAFYYSSDVRLRAIRNILSYERKFSKPKFIVSSLLSPCDVPCNVFWIYFSCAQGDSRHNTSQYCPCLLSIISHSILFQRSNQWLNYSQP